jgi:hypothetical protein
MHLNPLSKSTRQNENTSKHNLKKKQKQNNQQTSGEDPMQRGLMLQNDNQR